jgi:hypothetical protein
VGYTPVAGHYCLQVKLDWVDDSNPDNNLGQNNLDVAAAHSPAHFTFQLRNAFTETRRYTFKVDIYSPLPVPDCGAVILSKDSRSARIKDVVAHYSSMNFAPASGWDVAITPSELSLDPKQEQTIAVDITPPAGWAGQQPFNINAFADTKFAGGLTLTVTKP